MLRRTLRWALAAGFVVVAARVIHALFPPVSGHLAVGFATALLALVGYAGSRVGVLD